MNFNQAFFGAYIVEFSVQDVHAIIEKCYEGNFSLYHVQHISEEKWQARVVIKDWMKFEQLTIQENIEVAIVKRVGILFFLMRFMQRKEWFIAFIMSFMLVFILQHTVIEVKYEQMPLFMQTQIEKELKQLGLYQWAWIPSIEESPRMESYLMQKMSSIQRVQIKRTGNKYVVAVDEKERVQEEVEKKPQHLVASKAGVIEKVQITQGEVVVNRHELVKKGDLLVSGKIENENNEKLKQFVPAEGAVYANTWYEMNVSMPTTMYTEKHTGKYINQYRLYISDWYAPIWGNIVHRYEPDKETHMTIKEWHLHKNLPFAIKQQHFYEKQQIEKHLTKKQLQTYMETYIMKHLKKNLGKHVKIKKYYILHEQHDNGKVKWNLYVSVVENIAEPKQIKRKR